MLSDGPLPTVFHVSEEQKWVTVAAISSSPSGRAATQSTGLLDCLFVYFFIFYDSFSLSIFSSPEHKVLRVSYCDWPLSVVHRRPSSVPYFFYIFGHLKIIIFFADRIIGITPKLTENLEPNTKLIVYKYKYCTYRYITLFGKVRRCRTHITWVTYGYYWVLL